MGKFHSTILALGAALLLNGATCNPPPPVMEPEQYVVPDEVPDECGSRLELITEHFRHNDIQKVFIQYEDRRMKFQYTHEAIFISVSDRGDEWFPYNPPIVGIIDDMDDQGRFGVPDLISYIERRDDDYVVVWDTEIDSTQRWAAYDIECAVVETIANAIVRGDLVAYDHSDIQFNVDTTLPAGCFDDALERLLPDTAVPPPAHVSE